MAYKNGKGDSKGVLALYALINRVTHKQVDMGFHFGWLAS
jgi:hypothetical protein